MKSAFSKASFIALFLAFFALCAPACVFAQDADNEVFRSEEYLEQSETYEVTGNYDAPQPIDSPYNDAYAEQQDAYAEQQDAYAEQQGYYQPIAQPSYGQTITNLRIAGRIFSDLGFTLLYDSLFVGVGIGIIFTGVSHGYDDGIIASYIGGVGVIGIGGFLAPAFAVHTSHAIFDGMGRPGLGYAGAALGTLAGFLIGSLGYLADRETGSTLAGALGSIGGIVGAITWYELSDKRARETGYFAVQNLHPMLQVNDQRTVLGLGFQF